MDGRSLGRLIGADREIVLGYRDHTAIPFLGFSSRTYLSPAVDNNLVSSGYPNSGLCDGANLLDSVGRMGAAGGLDQERARHANLAGQYICEVPRITSNQRAFESGWTVRYPLLDNTG